MTKCLMSTIAIALLATAGCNMFNRAEARDAGPAVDRSYQVAAFDRIEVAGPYDVTVKTGGAPGVRAHGGESILAETEFVVESGVLKIKPKKRNGIRWNFGDQGKVTVAVTTPGLRGATIAGSGGIRIDRVSGTAFEGEIAGSGDLTVDAINSESVALAVAGSGEIRAAGQTRKLDLSIAGSGDVDVSALEATTADVSIAGSGNVRARSTGTADVSIMGSGDVELTGGAKCSVSKNGSGNVRCS